MCLHFFKQSKASYSRGGSIDQPAVLELLRDGSKGTIVDRTRLLAIVLLSQEKLSKSMEEEFTSAFSEGCQSNNEDGNPYNSAEEVADALKSVTFLLKLHKLQGPMGGMGAFDGGLGSGGGGHSVVSSLFSTVTSMATSTSRPHHCLVSSYLCMSLG